MRVRFQTSVRVVTSWEADVEESDLLPDTCTIDTRCLHDALANKTAVAVDVSEWDDGRIDSESIEWDD